jgi:hypothetical protein
MLQEASPEEMLKEVQLMIKGKLAKVSENAVIQEPLRKKDTHLNQFGP